MLEYKCDKCGTELGYKGLCFKCKAEEERNKTLALTDDEIKEIINKYVKDLKEKNVDKELLNGIYIYDLIAYRNIDLKDIAKKALEKKIYYPEVFYYKASEEIRDELIWPRTVDFLQCLTETFEGLNTTGLRPIPDNHGKTPDNP